MAEPTPAQVEAAARVWSGFAKPAPASLDRARAALTAAAQVQPEPCPDCRVTAAHDEGCPRLGLAPEADERRPMCQRCGRYLDEGGHAPWCPQPAPEADEREALYGEAIDAGAEALGFNPLPETYIKVVRAVVDALARRSQPAPRTVSAAGHAPDCAALMCPTCTTGPYPCDCQEAPRG